jgi:hypothetical protein
VSTGTPRWAQNACLEAFGIHARALSAFLANNGNHDDDVLAKHYSADWLAEDSVPGLVQIVHKQVAHLTEVRFKKEPINPWEAHDVLIETFQRFIQAVPEPRRQWFDWFR